MEFEGSDSGIINFSKKESSGSCCWAKKSMSRGRNNRPAGLKYSGKRKVWAPRALSRTLATYAPSRPVFLDPPGLVLGA